MPVVTFSLTGSCYGNVCCDKTGKIVKQCYVYIKLLHGGEEKCLQDFDVETTRKETTWKT